MKSHAPSIITLTLLICSCTAETTPNTTQQPSAPQQAPAATTRTITSENGMLSATPGVINLCEAEDGIISSHVSWDASSTDAEGVEVWLQGKEEAEPKLWSADGPVSSSTTGKWLREGHQITLIDGASKSELAKLEIKAITCQQ